MESQNIIEAIIEYRWMKSKEMFDSTATIQSLLYRLDEVRPYRRGLVNTKSLSLLGLGGSACRSVKVDVPILPTYRNQKLTLKLTERLRT